MEIANILILRRSDLHELDKDRHISRIGHSNFNVPILEFERATLVIFIDNDLQIKQLKSKFSYLRIAPNISEQPEFISEFWSPQFVSLEKQLKDNPGYIIHSVHLLGYHENGDEQFRLILKKA